MSHQIAAEFMRVWQGHRMFCDGWHCKPLTTEVASIQGVDALMEQRKHHVRNPKFRPYIARR
eukprot:2182365-Amphidinium_carterae.1